MKFKKLLPLVLVAPLLAGCGGGVKVEKPSFSNYSNKVDYDTYVTKLSLAALAANMESLTTVDSYEAKGNKSSAVKLNYNLDSEVNYDYKSSVEANGKYDATNLTLQYDQKQQGESKLKTSTVKLEETGKYDESYLDEIVDGKAVTLDLKEKTYSENSTNDSTDYIKSYALATMLFFVNDSEYVCSEYTTLEDEEKSNYSFYVDDLVFTWVYSKTEETEIKDGKDDTKVIGKAKSTTTTEYQVSYSTNNFRGVSAEVSEVSIEFTADGLLSNSKYNIYEFVKAGQKATNKFEDYCSKELQIKDVNLNKVDLADYKKTGEDD